jgi:hypothetical protein
VEGEGQKPGRNAVSDRRRFLTGSEIHLCFMAIISNPFDVASSGDGANSGEGIGIGCDGDT